MELKRGEIIVPEKYYKPKSFRNLVFNKISPTEITGYIEYQEKFMVFFQVKNGYLNNGQRRAFRMLTKHINLPSFFLVCGYDEELNKEEIDVSTAYIRFHYEKGEYKEHLKGMQLREFLDNLFEVYGGQ